MSDLETEVQEPEATPEPTPEPTPEATPEPEAWQGPSQEEWDQTQTTLSQAQELLDYLQTPSYDTPQPQQAELPAYDPFDPESAQAYFEARDQRLLGQMQEMFAPMMERESHETASQWADQTFQRLGVPEDDLWQEAVLFTSAGFQQFDEYGRPLVHPQQAAAQGYSFLQRFADMIREQEREAAKTGEAQQDEALRNRAGAPELPSGPAGGEGFPEGMDELQAARLWRERQVS